MNSRSISIMAEVRRNREAFSERFEATSAGWWGSGEQTLKSGHKAIALPPRPPIDITKGPRAA